ncbi:MAG: DUF1624 domain-containing protein [Rhizobiaceae bacterium]|nr:DUF1624 domain-containing protein [Rhizobiaceae bacterium]
MKQGRIELLDLARGVALIAMTVFHFGFDLELLGFREPGYINQPHWKYFARVIASSFLFLAGFGLYLAHARAIRWQAWRMRMAKILAAAMLITIATYFATPDQYIFFGILHQIGFASLAGLLFLRWHWAILVLLAVVVFLLGQYGRTDALNMPFLYWTGLSGIRPVSSDYVPVFPWFSAPLLGIAFAKLAAKRDWLTILARPKADAVLYKPLKFIGRHSLVFYLLHQPVMLALMIGISWIMGWIVFT